MSTFPSAAVDALDEAVACLRVGGLIAFPTDTVYGVGALAGDDRAVERLFQAKRRPPDKAIPILLASTDELAGIVEDVSAVARRLIETYWPGALTLVFRKGSRFRSLALVGGETVAVRVPDHPLARELIRRAGEPLAGTSANLSGRASPLTADEVRDQLGDAVDVVIDGGRCRGGVESSVVDVTVDPPRLLREGAIPRSELERVAGVRLA